MQKFNIDYSFCNIWDYYQRLSYYQVNLLQHMGYFPLLVYKL